MKDKALITETQIMAPAKAPRPNISDQELDRDLVNLHLPEIDLVATPDEVASHYRPGAFDALLAELSE